MQMKSSNSVQIFYPKYNKKEITNKLQGKIPALKSLLSISKVILFGSYAKDKYTVASDVDVLVIYKGKSRSDAYSIVKRIFDIPQIEIHIYTVRQYQKLKGTISKMIDDGYVVIYEENPR
jgi:predicted nucleotidyltransferase